MQVLCWKAPFQSVQGEQEGDPEVCQWRRGSRYHQPSLSKNGSCNKEIKGSTRSGTDRVTNRTNHEGVVQEICSHHGGLPEDFSGGSSSSSPTTEAHCRSDETTGHPEDSCYHRGNNTRINTQTHTGKGTDTTTQTTGRKSAIRSRPKKSTVETTTTTGGRNRSYHYCSGRGNSLVEESINQEKHLIPALRKMIEAALDAIDTLTA